MQTTNDARTLLSKNPNVKEIAYANYANEMKRLGNEGRKEWLKVKVDPISQSAKALYAKEIASLDAKLEVARTNAPKERQAQLIAKEQWKAVKADNPNITKEEASRAKDQLLQKARASVGASKKDVEIHVTKKEWEAINANAISHSKVTTILNNMNSKELKELALPKQKKIVSDTQKARMKAMSNTYTIAQIAEALGVSPSTVSKAIGGKED
jgi:DNA-binding CsgD family transcriptional regulator